MRLFIAIELIDRVKDELSMIQKRIKLQGRCVLRTSKM